MLNNPTGTNLGDPGNTLSQPTDLLKINFSGDSATGNISATALGNSSNLAFPHSISEPVRMGDTLYSFIPNADNNTITLMALPGCAQSGIPSSTQAAPSAYTYSTPGNYLITLYMDEGLHTQTTLCKEIIVVVAGPIVSITNGTLTVSGAYTSYQWYRNGVLIPGATSATYTATQAGDYYVKATSAYCSLQSNTLTVQAGGIYNIQGNVISIYPNPTADILFINILRK